MSEETTQRPRYRIVVRSLPGVVDYADNPHDAALIAVNLAKDARGHTARAFATIFGPNGKDLPVFPDAILQEVEDLITDRLG